MMNKNLQIYLLLAQKDAKTITDHIRQMLSYSKKHCYHCGLDTETAKDITITSVQKLLEDIEKGRFVYWEKPPIVWAKAIAKKRILEAINLKNRKWNFSKINEFVEEIAEYEDVKSQNDKEMVNLMLSFLSPKEQLLLTLHYLMGYTYKQIVEQKLMHYTTENSVKQTCKRTIDKLKAKFPNKNSFDFQVLML